MTVTHDRSGPDVLLVRHGQSTWNADGRWQGQADPPLSDIGERQAAEAAGALAGLDVPIDAVWASDLERARRTGEIVAEALGLEVRLDPRLRERHAGPWQGLTRDEIDIEWPDHLSSGRRPEGYEADADVLARVLAALADLARAHPRGHVLVVTHGGVVRVVERHLGGDDGALLPNLSGRRIRGGAGGTWALGDPVLLLDEGSVTVPGQL
ncbi:MAG TPA: histidine phosphatase family protein [Acidimicrobiia bacterium]|nr:histidine phosphatase family protein [Acidimicrobiia bacterium]